MSTEITLAVGATAEPNTCGSCRFFKRDNFNGPYEQSRGGCGFKFPPRFDAGFALKPYEEGDENRYRISDTERCDLYQSDGKVYIVQRRVGS